MTLKQTVLLEPHTADYIDRIRKSSISLKDATIQHIVSASLSIAADHYESLSTVNKMSITMDENLKIRHLMAAIEAMEGVKIPFPTGRKLVDVYGELKDLLGRETVV